MAAVTMQGDNADGVPRLLGPVPRRNLPMLTDRVFPVLRTLIRLGYFSLTVEGAEHVPRSGPTMYVGNHAGWFTLDTLMGAVAVADHVGLDRLPWGAVQDELLKVPKLGTFFEGVGGFPASWLRTPEAIPPEMDVFSVYPEGVDGNCKSFLYAYRMRPWRTGFLRIAALRKAAIVPVAIIGGEECLPVAAPIRALKPLLGSIIPLPLSLIPLPTRWKFVFHEPVFVSPGDLLLGQGDAEVTRRRAQHIASRVQERVQRTLDQETAHRALVRFSKRILREGSSAGRPAAIPASLPVAAKTHA